MHKYTYARNIAQLYQNFNCRKYDGFGNRIDDTEKGSAGLSPPLGRVFTPNTRTEYSTVAHEMDTVSSLWFDSKWCIIQTLSSVGPKTTFKRCLPVRCRLQLNLVTQYWRFSLSIVMVRSYFMYKKVNGVLHKLSTIQACPYCLFQVWYITHNFTLLWLDGRKLQNMGKQSWQK